MSPLLLSVLIASALGSLHCAGMCGGIAGIAAAGGSRPDTRRSSWMNIVVYQVGRLAAYLVLGALSGLLGRGVNQAGDWAGVSQGAAWAAAAVMIVWGLLMLRGSVPVKRSTKNVVGLRSVQRGAAAWFSWAQVSERLKGAFSVALSWGRALPGPLRATWLGLATGLLPCGWLYSFLILAAGTGGALAGASVLGVFWLGSVPVLSGMGALARQLNGRAQGWLRVASALLLVGFGLGNLWTRVSMAADLQAGPHQTAVSGHDGPATPACH